MAADIVLATFNARYSHASFGLRCLRANLGSLRDRSEILEATLETRPLALVEQILSRSPRVVGFGVYVWNAQLSLQAVRLLKQVAPEIVIVLGGPEVSHETLDQDVCRHADFVIRGEGEVAFHDLCQRTLAPTSLRVHLPHAPPGAHAPTSLMGAHAPTSLMGLQPIDGGTPDLGMLQLPYGEYTEEDLRHRTIYVEASRGCPFRCAFCLSALDRSVRAFPIDAFLGELDALYVRGLRRFKFVDRTFNLAIDDACRILAFFLERHPEDLFLHFEMIPDRLPERLLHVLTRFPRGTVQLEIGFQTFDPGVAKIIQRRTDFERAVENVRVLRAQTGVHIHADLIAGLPGETWQTFASGFDRLVAAGPQEIQLGILKRLRGAPLTKLPEARELVFDREAPYEVLQTPTLSFPQLMELRRMARVWDLVFNQGRARATAALLLETWQGQGSVFEGLRELVQAMHAGGTPLHGMAFSRLLELVYHYLLDRGVDPQRTLAAVSEDHDRSGLKGRLAFLSEGTNHHNRARVGREGPPPRQRRHLAYSAKTRNTAG